VTERKVSLDGISAILFDLDGTLRHSRPSYDEALFEISVQVGLECRDERRLKALRWAHSYWAQSPELMQDLQTFQENQDRFLINYVRRYLLILGCEPEQVAAIAPQIYNRLEETHLRKDWVPAEVPETLERLKQAGFTLAVVSNREKPLDDLLDRLNLSAYFDFTLTASQAGSWKPDVKIFQYAVQRAGTTPERAIYVGDNYFTDIIGARRAGLVPVLLDPEGIFPEAECPVICSLSDLSQALA
jgi:HAD superfamily hydrolase (TIGR01549 family)